MEESQLFGRLIESKADYVADNDIPFTETIRELLEEQGYHEVMGIFYERLQKKDDRSLGRGSDRQVSFHDGKLTSPI